MNSYSKIVAASLLLTTITIAHAAGLWNEIYNMEYDNIRSFFGDEEVYARKIDKDRFEDYKEKHEENDEDQ